MTTESVAESMEGVMAELRENPKARVLALCPNNELARTFAGELYTRFSEEFPRGVSVFSGHPGLIHASGGSVDFRPSTRDPRYLNGMRWSLFWLICTPEQFKLLAAIEIVEHSLTLGQRKIIRAES